MRVYIHVPFCRSKCSYCDFYSTPRHEMMGKYVDTIGEEWLAIPERATPDTIYIGGGTPSCLPLHMLDRLISHISITTPLREFTIEANPEDVTLKWATHITAKTAIDRVSMGIQTFNDTTLSFLGRRHSGKQAEIAIGILRRAGVSNLSCDLIYGLPGQSLDDWRRDLDRLIGIRPEHISAYLLSYEPRTRLGGMLKKGTVEETSDTLAEQMYQYLCEATRSAGYRHYEISNFALPGHESLHNSSYWDGSDYIGLGPGAHSMVRGTRWHNPSDLHSYLLNRGRNFRVIEEEDAKNRFNDLLITALRTARGLDPADIPEEFSDNFRATSSRLLSAGNLSYTDQGRLIIPESRWLTSNTILLDLIEV